MFWGRVAAENEDLRVELEREKLLRAAAERRESRLLAALRIQGEVVTIRPPAVILVQAS